MLLDLALIMGAGGAIIARVDPHRDRSGSIHRHAQWHGPRPRSCADSGAGDTALADDGANPNPHVCLVQRHAGCRRGLGLLGCWRADTGCNFAGNSRSQRNARRLWKLCGADAALRAGLLFLPRSVESTSPKGFQVTPEAKRVVFKISALFSIDAGGGFITRTLMAQFFISNFGHEGVNEAVVGELYFLAAFPTFSPTSARRTLAAASGL